MCIQYVCMCVYFNKIFNFPSKYLAEAQKAAAAAAINPMTSLYGYKRRTLIHKERERECGCVFVCVCEREREAYTMYVGMTVNRFSCFSCAFLNNIWRAQRGRKFENV